MRVLFTDQFVRRAGPKAGVGHYAHELACALRRVAGADAVCSWRPGAWLRLRQKWLDRQSARYEAVARRSGTAAWAETKVRGKVLAAVRRAFPSMAHPFRHELARTGCTVYHEPNFIPLVLDLPTAVSVHDLSVVRFPEWHPPARVAAFEKCFAPGLRQAAHLIAISEFGKSEIVRHLGWPADRVSVTYMGVRPDLRPVAGAELAAGLAELGLAPGYLLHVGTIEPRKNLPLLIRAYAALPAAVRDKHPLVLVGKPGWKCEAVHEYIASEGKDTNVRRGRLDDSLIVFTGDQGEPLGEHGYVRRFRPWLYEELIHTPLIVRMPGGESAGRDTTPWCRRSTSCRPCSRPSASRRTRRRTATTSCR
jgi:alpha-1,3-rhamnosyl/mannosyltransferase